MVLDHFHLFQFTMADQQQFFLKWNDFQSNMVSSFRHLRDEKSFTDVTLACEGQTCKAHKMVLSACSPYFKSLLEVMFQFAVFSRFHYSRLAFLFLLSCQL